VIKSEKDLTVKIIKSLFIDKEVKNLIAHFNLEFKSFDTRELDLNLSISIENLEKLLQVFKKVEIIYLLNPDSEKYKNRIQKHFKKFKFIFKPTKKEKEIFLKKYKFERVYTNIDIFNTYKVIPIKKIQILFYTFPYLEKVNFLRNKCYTMEEQEVIKKLFPEIEFNFINIEKNITAEDLLEKYNLNLLNKKIIKLTLYKTVAIENMSLIFKEFPNLKEVHLSKNSYTKEQKEKIVVKNKNLKFIFN
jgi:uncharacterized protein YktA (UPF0223 family)